MLADPVLAAFPPEFARFGSTVQPPQPTAVPLRELLQPDAMVALARTYGASLSSNDRRATLSMWSQYYMLALLPPIVAAALVASRLPDVAFRTAGVVLSPEGCPIAVCLPGLDRPLSDDCAAKRLTPLLRDHLEPLAQAMAAAGLHPAVLWSNAGHVLLWLLKTLLAPPDRLSHLSEQLQGTAWIDGGPNLLQPTMARNSRAVCCLRHRLPGTPRCGSCPVVLRSTARAGLKPAGIAED